MELTERQNYRLGSLVDAAVQDAEKYLARWRQLDPNRFAPEHAAAENELALLVSIASALSENVAVGS